MEFEDEHDEELEEEEEDEDEEEITIPPPSLPPSYDSIGVTNTTSTNTNSVTHQPPRLSTNMIRNSLIGRRSGVVRYRECLKNHAVNIGGHAVDGCCEFMAAGEEGTLDALKCAACNCHRNFHRKEIDPTVVVGGEPHAPTQIHTPTPFTGYYRAAPPAAPPMGYLHVSAPHHRPISVVPTTSGGTHSGGDMADDMSHPSSSGGGTTNTTKVIMREGGNDGCDGGGGGSSKKRYRTKFSQEQKDKMLAFAEKLGWRIQKHDEGAVQQFCTEIQVKRQVLKVWMHNNKHTLGKKP